MPNNRLRYILTIVDVGGRLDAPATVRLRRLLKMLLRGYAFRCSEITPITRNSPMTKSDKRNPAAAAERLRQIARSLMRLDTTALLGATIELDAIACQLDGQQPRKHLGTPKPGKVCATVTNRSVDDEQEDSLAHGGYGVGDSTSLG